MLGIGKITPCDLGVNERELLDIENTSIAPYSFTASKIQHLLDLGIDIQNLEDFSLSAQSFIIRSRVGILKIFSDIDFNLDNLSSLLEENIFLRRSLLYAPLESLTLFIEKFEIKSLEELSQYILSSGVYSFLKQGNKHTWDNVKQISSFLNCDKEGLLKIIENYISHGLNHFLLEGENAKILLDFVTFSTLEELLYYLKSKKSIVDFLKSDVEKVKKFMSLLNVKKRSEFEFFIDMPELAYLIESPYRYLGADLCRAFDLGSMEEFYKFMTGKNMGSWVKKHFHDFEAMKLFHSGKHFSNHVEKSFRVMQFGLSELRLFSEVFGSSIDELINFFDKHKLLMRLNSKGFKSFSEKISLLALDDIHAFSNFIYIFSQQSSFGAVQSFFEKDISPVTLSIFFKQIGIESFNSLLQNNNLFRYLKLHEEIILALVDTNLIEVFLKRNYSVKDLSIIKANYQSYSEYICTFGVPNQMQLEILGNLGSKKMSFLKCFFIGEADGERDLFGWQEEISTFFSWKYCKEYMENPINLDKIIFFMNKLGLQGFDGFKKLYEMQEIRLSLEDNSWELKYLKKFMEDFHFSNMQEIFSISNISGILGKYNKNFINKLREKTGSEINLELLQQICKSKVMVGVILNGDIDTYKILQSENRFVSDYVDDNCKVYQGTCESNERLNAPIFSLKSKKYILIEIEGRIVGHIKLQGEKTFISYVNLEDSNGKIFLVKGGIYSLENYDEIISSKICPEEGKEFIYSFSNSHRPNFNFHRLSNLKNMRQKILQLQSSIVGSEKVYIN